MDEMINVAKNLGRIADALEKMAPKKLGHMETKDMRAIFSLELTERLNVARKIREMLGDRCKLPMIMSDDEMMAACYAGFRYKNPDVKDVLVVFIDNTDGKADFTVKTIVGG